MALKFELTAYGDGKPTTRLCRKSPGQLTLHLQQHYGSPFVGLQLEVNPVTGYWELVAIRGNDRTLINEGTIGPEGVTCLDPSRI